MTRISTIPQKFINFANIQKCAMMTSFLNKKYKVTFTKNDFVFNSSNIKKQSEVKIITQ